MIRFSASLAVVAWLIQGLPPEGRVVAGAVSITWFLLQPAPRAVIA